MALNIGLISALGEADDVLGRSRLDGSEKIDSYTLTRDPTLQKMLDSGTLDPLTRSVLIQRDNARIKKTRKQRQIAEIEQKLKGEEINDGMISWLGPIPLGFQFGTYLGIENTFWRLAMDIVADPVNLVSGGAFSPFSKGLNALGRGVKNLANVGTKALKPEAFKQMRTLVRAGKFDEAAKIAPRLADLHLSPAQKARSMGEAASLLGHMGVDGKVAGSLKTALLTHDFDSASKIIKKIQKNPLSKEQLKTLEKFDPDLAKWLRNDKQEIKALEAVFKVQDKEKQIKFASGLVDGLITGQRDLVNFAIPFTAKELGALRFSSLFKHFKGTSADDMAKAAKAGAKSVLGKTISDPLGMKAAKNILVEVGDAAIAKKGTELIRDVGKSFNSLISLETHAATIKAAGNVGMDAKNVHAAEQSAANVIGDVVGGTEHFASEMGDAVLVAAKTPEKRELFATLIEESSRFTPQKIGQSPLAANPKAKALTDLELEAAEELNTVMTQVGEQLVNADVFGQEAFETFAGQYIMRSFEKINLGELSKYVSGRRTKAARSIGKTTVNFGGIKVDAELFASAVGGNKGDMKTMIGQIFARTDPNKQRLFRGTKHSFGRVFPTLNQAIKHLDTSARKRGFKLFNTDQADLAVSLPKYLNTVGKAAARNNLFNSYLKTSVNDSRLPLIMRRMMIREQDIDGLSNMFKLVERTPDGVQKVALMKKLDKGNFKALGTTSKGAIVRDFQEMYPGVKFDDFLMSNSNSFKKIDSGSYQGWMVHKAIHPHINAAYADNAFDAFRSSKIYRGIDRINAIGKGSVFSLNPFFHINAMGIMSAMASVPPAVAYKMWFGPTGIFKQGHETITSVWAKSNGLRDFFNNMADPVNIAEQNARMMSRTIGGVNGENLTKIAKVSGVSLDRSITAAEGFSEVQKLLNKGIDGIGDGSMLARAVTKPMTGVKHFNVLSDFALWSLVQNNVKLVAFAHLAQSGQEAYQIANKVPALGTELNKIYQQAAASTNTFMGNMNWERLAIDPTMGKIMRFAMLAPDWTTSNIKAGLDMFVNIPGVKQSVIGSKLSRDVVVPSLAAQWAIQYNMRAAFYTLMGANVLNWGFTKYRTGDGRFLWQNDKESFDKRSGFQSRVELPWTRPDGRRQYMDVFKQFLEPWHAMTGTLDFAKSKIGVVPRVIQTGIFGRDAFGNEIAGIEDGNLKTIMKQFGAAAGQFAPIVAQQAMRVHGGGLPVQGFGASTLGFPIRSESLQGFQRRERLKVLKEELQQLQ